MSKRPDLIIRDDFEEDSMIEGSTPRTKIVMEWVRELPQATGEHFFAVRDCIEASVSRLERELAALETDLLQQAARVTELNADCLACSRQVTEHHTAQIRAEAYAVTLQSLLRCISFTNDGILVKPQPGREDYGVFLHVTPGGTKATILQEFKALIDAALAGQPAKGNSKFSDFIRNAEGEERTAVFERVIDKSIERQREYEIGRIEDDFGPLASQEKGRAEWPPSSHAVGLLPEHTSNCAFNLPGTAPCDCGAPQPAAAESPNAHHEGEDVKGPCPNYFVRRNADNPPTKAWEVMRDNGDGEKAYPVARFASRAEAVARRDSIRARTQARRMREAGATP